MKHQTPLLLFVFTVMTFVSSRPNHLSKNQYQGIRDTIPQVCTYITSEEIRAIHPFTTLLTNIFPDPNSFENYTGCYYQFYTPSEKPQLAVRLIKWGSKQEATDDYIMQVRRHHESWGLAPERIKGIADSAFFDLNPEENDKCDECALVAIQGVYCIYISFKGQYEKVPRSAKKFSALRILQLIYDRIPGLTPPRVRIYQ